MRVLFLLLAASLLLAGCATTDDTTATPTPAGASTTTPASPSASITPPSTSAPSDPAGDIVVRSFAFTPANKTFPSGATVRWENQDATSHTATADDGSFSVALDGGSTNEAVFTKDGTYPYHCALHPGMRGVVVIGDPAGSATTEPPAETTPPATTTPATTTPSSTPPATTTPETETPPATPATQRVDIHNFRFIPATVTVPAGTTVEWKNSDGASHSATADAAGGFDTGVLSSGQSGTATFATPGTYAYHCKVHPSMTGTVTVTA